MLSFRFLHVDPRRFETVPMLEHILLQTVMRSVVDENYEDPVYLSTTQSIRFRAYGEMPMYWPDEEELSSHIDVLPHNATILLDAAWGTTNSILSGNSVYSRDFVYDDDTYGQFLEVCLKVTQDEALLEDVFLKHCERIIQARRDLFSDICVKLGSLDKD